MEQLDNQSTGHKMQYGNECRFMDELRENIGNMYGANGDNKELEVIDDAGTRHSLTTLWIQTSSTRIRTSLFVVVVDTRVTRMSTSFLIYQSHVQQQTLAPEVREKRCETTTTLVTLLR